MKEIWKDIEGYEGYYEVSNLGGANSFDRTVKRRDGINIKIKGRAMKLIINNKGYCETSLCKLCISTNKRLHRLVAEAFIPNQENKPCVNHKDGNKSNNNVDNLEWCTHKENMKHAWDTGLIPSHRKSPVSQYDKQGNFLKNYRTIAEAAKRNNTLSTYISRCCVGKLHSAGGYLWEYCWEGDVLDF